MGEKLVRLVYLLEIFSNSLKAAFTSEMALDEFRKNDYVDVTCSVLYLSGFVKKIVYLVIAYTRDLVCHKE